MSWLTQPQYITSGVRRGQPFLLKGGTVTGAVGAVTFSMSPESGLPPQQTIDPTTGDISGTYTDQYWYQIQATDQSGGPALKSHWFMIEAKPGPYNYTGGNYAGTVGANFAVNCENGNFNGNILKGVVWSVDGSSTVPAWMSVKTDSCGLYGLPDVAGTHSFKLRMTDTYDGAYTTSDFTVTIRNQDVASGGPILKGREKGWLARTEVIGNRPADFPDGSFWTGGVFANNVGGSGFGHVESWRLNEAGYFGGLKLEHTLYADPTRKIEGLFDLDVASALLIRNPLRGPVCMRTGEPFSTVAPDVQGSHGALTYSLGHGWATPYLPAGVSLNPQTGVISGTPTETGSGGLFIRATDAWDNASIGTDQVSIYSFPPLALVASGRETLFNFRLGEAFGVGFWADQTPYGMGTISLVEGALPPGLKLNGGVIQGVATQIGTYKAVFEIHDACDNKRARSPELTFNVNSKFLISSIPTNLAAAMGQPYRSAPAPTVAYPRPDQPLTWYLGSGTLPAGILVDASTGELHGSATEAGVFKFYIQARSGPNPWDSAYADSPQITLTVSPDPTVYVENPAEAYVGSDFILAPKALNFPRKVTWSLAGGQLPDGLTMQPSTGVVSGQTRNAGIVDNLVFTAQDETGATASSEPFRIRSLSLPETDIASVADTKAAAVYWIYQTIAYTEQPASWAVNQSLNEDRHEPNVLTALTDGWRITAGEYAGTNVPQILTHITVGSGHEIMFDYGKKVSADGWTIKTYDMGGMDVQAYYEQGGTWVPFARQGDYTMCGWMGILQGAHGSPVVAQRFKLRFNSTSENRQGIADAQITEHKGNNHWAEHRHWDYGYLPMWTSNGNTWASN